MVSGPMLLGASFRANGNLLSQWRGYSVHGKGVRLGFDPGQIHRCASRQGFQVGRCLYDRVLQRTLIEQIVDAVEGMAMDIEEERDCREAVFEKIEGRLLRFAAILKHPSFKEEQEWRIVSPVVTRAGERPVHFREGASMLVPYYTFELSAPGDPGLQLDHVYLGPTNNIDLSMNSLRQYLASRCAAPRRCISYCQIPCRQR